MKHKLTMADCHRKRREVLKNWFLGTVEQARGKEARDWPQTIDILDAIECCPGDRLRGG